MRQSASRARAHEEHVVLSSSQAVLGGIASPQVGLAIFQRSLEQDLRAASERAVVAELSWHGIVPAGTKASETDCPEALHPILSDLLSVASPLSRIEPDRAFRIRLETVSDDGCRLFHVDSVTMRLVTTYHGAGTVWIPPGQDAEDDSRANHRSMAAGDVALFKGSKSGDSPLILHRSPPVRSPSERRFVAVVDLAS